MTYYNFELEKLNRYAESRSWSLYLLQLYRVAHKFNLMSGEMSSYLFLLDLVEEIKKSLALTQVDNLLMSEVGKLKNGSTDEIIKLKELFRTSDQNIQDIDNYLYLYIGDYYDPTKKWSLPKDIDLARLFPELQIKTVKAKSGFPFYREKDIDKNKRFVLVQQSYKHLNAAGSNMLDMTTSYLIKRIKCEELKKNVVLYIDEFDKNEGSESNNFLRQILIEIIENTLEGNFSFNNIIIDFDTEKEVKLIQSLLDEILDFIEIKSDIKTKFESLITKLLENHKNNRKFQQPDLQLSDKPEINLRKKFSLNSTKMDGDFRLLNQIKDKDYSIIFLGESGSGKEYLARLIHSESNRSKNEFVVINCANVQKELLNSELFGHKKGAFTGAIGEKEGLVKKADKGTLFLDEIGDAPLDVQAALLTFLQDKKFRKVGGTIEEKANVRIIFATNQNLENLVDKKLFREDLYHRIMKYPINVMPLRDRLEDLPDLVDSIQANWVAEFKIKLIISDGFVKKLQTYNWPGNIRELNNVLERIFTLADGETERIIEENLFNPSSKFDVNYQTTFQLTDYENSTLEFFKIWLLQRTQISEVLKSTPELENEKEDSNLLSFGRSIIEPILANIYSENWKSLGIQSQKKAGETIGLTWGSPSGTLPEKQKIYPIVKKYFG